MSVRMVVSLMPKWFSAHWAMVMAAIQMYIVVFVHVDTSQPSMPLKNRSRMKV